MLRNLVLSSLEVTDCKVWSRQGSARNTQQLVDLELLSYD